MLNSIAMELVARKESTTLAHEPGKGGGEAMAAILGGHVMLNVESPAWPATVASGDLRLLALLNNKRSKKWSAVPTLAEHGYDWDFNAPFGLAGPKGMDPAVVKNCTMPLRRHTMTRRQSSCSSASTSRASISRLRTMPRRSPSSMSTSTKILERVGLIKN